jgi:hypothetical protein
MTTGAGYGGLLGLAAKSAVSNACETTTQSALKPPVAHVTETAAVDPELTSRAPKNGSDLLHESSRLPF